MTKHSHIIGGSTADRLLHCPGSFSLIQRLPQQIEVPSEYAEFGSHCHAVMDCIAQAFTDGLPDERTMAEYAAELEGDHIYDRVLTVATLADAILPAIETLYELMDIYGGDFRVVANELRVRFPGVPGAFGTTDLLLSNGKYMLLVDWKFGQGVPVKAVYTDPAGDLVNPQLMFYLAASLNTVPKFFKKHQFVVAIIQPRTEERLTHTAVTRKEAKDFVEDVENAIIAALEPNPPFQEGDHCRWCPAHPVCPLKTRALFEINEGGAVLPPRPVPANSDDGSYGAFLAKAKRLADYAAEYKKAIDEALHSYMENGGKVPGWKLKLKGKLRQWIDEQVVDPELRRLGFKTEDIWQTKLQTFAVADKAAKRLGVKIPEHLRVAPESTETTIALESDPAPAIDYDTVDADFREALTLLQAK